MATLGNSFHHSVKITISQPSSPSSTQQFPNELFSSMKRSLPPLETDFDETTEIQRGARNSSPSPTTIKTVRFFPDARVRETLSRHDMSSEERYEYWIQGHELQMIRQRNELRTQEIEESFNDDVKHNNDSKVRRDRIENETKEDVYLPDLGPSLGIENPRPRSCRYKHAALEEDLFEHQADVYYLDTIYDEDPFDEVCF